MGSFSFSFLTVTIEKPSYIDLGYHTKLKSITRIDMTKTFELPDRNIISVGADYSAFTSETSMRLFGEMSLMESVKKKRCYIALDYDTSPHRLQIQTRIRPSDGNIATVGAKRLRCAIHDHGGCATRVKALGMD